MRRRAPGQGSGRLTARPTGQVGGARPGLRPLGLEDGRDGLLYVPAVTGLVSFVLSLHGAGGRAEHALAPLLELAEAQGVALLAPESRGRTWDLLEGGYGPDVAFIERALAVAFASCRPDAGRLAASGFSDGASYALSLGLTNGELFSHVAAFSPGFAAVDDPHGSPLVYVSHGTRDEVLPVACSRRIVPLLRKAGYEVVYHEFDGPHVVPQTVAREAMAWLAGAAH